MGELSDVTRHEVSDLRSRWDAMVFAFEGILGDVQSMESERNSLRREAERWKQSSEQALEQARVARQAGSAVVERMAGLEEALEFILVSHQGGLTRLSPAVTAMVEALCAEIRGRREAAPGDESSPAGLLLVSD